MKTLYDSFGELRNHCHVAQAAAYLIRDDFNTIKADNLSIKRLSELVQQSSERLKSIEERLVIASDISYIIEKYLSQTNVDINKEFNDEEIKKKLDESWEKTDKICEEVRKKQAIKK